MFLRSIALSVVSCGLVLAQPTTSTTTTRTSTVGPVGVGSTETIQITVVNLATNPQNGAAASCAGSIGFNDSTGKAIGTATNFTVTSGQMSSVGLPFNRIAATGTRAEVTGVVSLTTSSSNRTPCQLKYVLETFDTATGATHVYLSGESFGGGIMPPIGGGPIGR